MSSLARELDEYLQSLDPERAQHVEAAIRGLMAMTKAQPPLDLDVPIDESDGLDSLAAFAEPMGPMTNEEIDRAIYGS
ncbi:MAG TPA: hypothetical protein VGO11_02060 [Chthoniobacteraceae bacterium]|jgi:hypothetical protein|nr:hypothetical protein [Chthoniobacteraceae bacterium]